MAAMSSRRQRIPQFYLLITDFQEKTLMLAKKEKPATPDFGQMPAKASKRRRLKHVRCNDIDRHIVIRRRRPFRPRIPCFDRCVRIVSRSRSRGVVVTSRKAHREYHGHLQSNDDENIPHECTIHRISFRFFHNGCTTFHSKRKARRANPRCVDPNPTGEKNC